MSEFFKAGYDAAQKKRGNDGWLVYPFQNEVTDNPHKRGTKPHVEWHNGFYQGRKDLGYR